MKLTHIVTFIKYKNVYNDDILYAVEDPVTKLIDNVHYTEVTTSLDTPRIQFIRSDSLKPVGKVQKEFK